MCAIVILMKMKPELFAAVLATLHGVSETYTSTLIPFLYVQLYLLLPLFVHYRLPYQRLLWMGQWQHTHELPKLYWY